MASRNWRQRRHKRNWRHRRLDCADPDADAIRRGHDHVYRSCWFQEHSYHRPCSGYTSCDIYAVTGSIQRRHRARTTSTTSRLLPRVRRTARRLARLPLLKSLKILPASAPSGAADAIEIFIPDHAGTTFQKVGVGRNTITRSTTVSANNFIESTRFYWRSTAAITSVTLTLASGNYDVGSTFTLWGESDAAPALLTTNSNLISETILCCGSGNDLDSEHPAGLQGSPRLHRRSRRCGCNVCQSADAVQR